MGSGVFVHLGLAKCASTSIQHALQSTEGIDYAGCFTGREDRCFWEEPWLATLFDRHLRFSCQDLAHWQGKISHYLENRTQAVVFSSENLSLRFLPWDLPTSFKLRALAQIFPPDTQFILVYRDPFQILVSLYKEWLLMGYRGSYEQFCDEANAMRDFCFVTDLCIGAFLRRFAEHLTEHTLHVIALDQEDLWPRLTQILGVTVAAPEMPLNPSPNAAASEAIRRFNTEHGDFDALFDTIEWHRAAPQAADSRRFATARKRRLRRGVGSTMAEFVEGFDPFAGRHPQLVQHFIEDIGSAGELLARHDALPGHLERMLRQWQGPGP